MIKLKTESSEMLHLDALRFFAATAIVLYHWRDNFSGIAGTWLSEQHCNFLNLAVDLFFLISGVVIFHVYSGRLSSWGDFATFIQRRLARLYPLHLLTFCIMLLLGLAIRYRHLAIASPENYSLRGVLPNLLLIQSFPVVNHVSFNSPSWSISAEMMCYLLFPVILYFSRMRWWLPLALGFLGICGLLTWANGWDWTEWTFNFGCLRALPSFLFGVGLGNSRAYLRRIPYPNVLLCTVTCVLFVVGYEGFSRGILLLLVYLIGVFAFAADVQGSAGPLITRIAPLGVLTYSIYMIHRLVQAFVFRGVFGRFSISPLLNNTLILFSFFPLLVLAYISYQYFETPARRWLSGRRNIARKSIA